MTFNHDNMIGVHLAVELVNLHTEDGWSRRTVEGALARGLVRFDAVDVEPLFELREAARELHTVFAAVARDERCERINVLLDEGVRRVHLTVHDDLPPHLHFAGAESGLVQRVRATTIGGLAIFAVETGAERMSVCARPECPKVFVDTSKNGRRAYCTAQCGNSEAVLRYRERRSRSSSL